LPIPQDIVLEERGKAQEKNFCEKQLKKVKPYDKMIMYISIE
jgi:hypothetical protein